MAKKTGTKKSSTFAVFLAVIFILAWLGVMFTLFPVGNPMQSIGGTAGIGIFYAALLSLGLLIVIVLYFVMRTAVRDVVKSIGDELGVDLFRVGSDYKTIFLDDLLAMVGKKKKVSDHHDD